MVVVVVVLWLLFSTRAYTMKFEPEISVTASAGKAIHPIIGDIIQKVDATSR